MFKNNYELFLPKGVRLEEEVASSEPLKDVSYAFDKIIKSMVSPSAWRRIKLLNVLRLLRIANRINKLARDFLSASSQHGYAPMGEVLSQAIIELCQMAGAIYIKSVSAGDGSSILSHHIKISYPRSAEISVRAAKIDHGYELIVTVKGLGETVTSCVKAGYNQDDSA
jgi:hypothetical protein